MFNADASQVRVFLEDGSLMEYSIEENTLAGVRASVRLAFHSPLPTRRLGARRRNG